MYQMAIDMAVLGSCVSRDLFNSKFNRNYKEFYNCVLTQNQTSIISLMSTPVAYSSNPEDGLSAYQEWNVRSDLSKEFLDLIKEKQPKYLILDFFADVHFGCLQIGRDQWITDNRWMLHKTSYYDSMIKKGQLRRVTIDEDTEEYFALWKHAIDKLFEFLKLEVPDCNVILNQARNVEYFVTDSGERKSLNSSGKVYPVNVTRLNELWEMLDDYVLSNHRVSSLNVFREDITSLEGHPWGPFYVHYTMDYYQDSMNALHRIVLKDELSLRTGDFCSKIFSELGKADVQKTAMIRKKTKEIVAYKKQLKAAEEKAEPLLLNRCKRFVKRIVISPLQNVYQRT